MQQDHSPLGNPCRQCGKSAFRHRPEHVPVGDPCEQCHLPANRHRTSRIANKNANPPLYIGIDGEGQGRRNHRYVLLGASSEDGSQQWYIDNPDGLTTEECLDFILNLPQVNVKTFGYSLNYDWTKILEDLPNETLYRLFRPELRQRTGADAVKGPKPVYWRGYRLNLQGTKFTLSKGDRYRVIWDCFKFFQAKFVNALEDWKVGNSELWERMRAMKDQRGNFDKVSKVKVREYCLEECMCMAQLAHKLINAHQAVGLKLKNFYGAGSSGAAMLDVMSIKNCIKIQPKEMNIAVSSAFFGGRFENSVIGTVEGTVYNYDISSAYPYQLYFLPCLVHARWSKTSKRNSIDSARTALVRYSLGPSSETTWGPFPFRESSGNICFPIESGGGWVWKDEFIAGEKLFPNVKFEEAFIYHSNCDCRPFHHIAGYYSERCRIGKEGPGIVLKLGCNSCYGKLAQSVGNGKFQSWVWAGMITSGCRAQILQVMDLHQDKSNILMIATDGVQSREDLIMPTPFDTGTSSTGKPLGGWEKDIHGNGVFYARPGIYFPLNPTAKQLKKVKARGVGKAVVLEHWKDIVDSWEKDNINNAVRIAEVTRFHGAKTSITKDEHGYTRSDRYGNWNTRPVDMGFNPMPKRAGINPDGKTLTLRRLSSKNSSTPYKKAMLGSEAKLAKLLQQEMLEQPEYDFSDYEVEDGIVD
jgi:hypothetical protein